MSEEKVYDAKEPSFYDEVNWDTVVHNKITKEKFVEIKARNSKVYATFLGPNESPAFYMFRPLKWGMYKEIRSKNLDKDSMNEYIVNTCVLWPIMDPIQIADEDAGIMLTLVYQIMAVSNFLSDPAKSLELIYEI